MHKLDTIKNIYFIGIGGIGMSALARYFVSKGCVVSGYDKTKTVLTEALSELGIHIHYEDNTSLIDTKADVVVYTPAIPESHTELSYFRENGYEVVKRSDILGWITEGTVNICVAGTHGKTTVSTMVAHVLRDSGYGCTAFLGGIAANYNTNFWSSDNDVVVVEADEYDRSFLKLSPNIISISAVDADHLDIYENEQDIQKNFRAFMALVALDGIKIVNANLGLDGTTYSLDEDLEADYLGTEIRIENGTYGFRIKHNSRKTEPITCGLPGRHNVENALAAAAAAHQMGLKWPAIKTGIETFMGVKRRFDIHIKTENFVYIDDYAHHPKELIALLNSVKELLGHASLASTQVYTHNSVEKMKKVYNQAHPRSQKK